MTPFWDPNFNPPCHQLAAPYLYVHEKPGPNFQVVHLDIGPRSCILSCEPLALPWPSEPPVGMTPILVILASLPHLANPWCPDAGPLGGTRLGEGSREVLT